jgi:hypothetical protein
MVSPSLSFDNQQAKDTIKTLFNEVFFLLFQILRAVNGKKHQAPFFVSIFDDSDINRRTDNARSGKTTDEISN